MFATRGRNAGNEREDMGAIPGGIDTDQQPPMTIPLRHFVVGLAFLMAGAFAGALGPLGVVPGRAGVAHAHLLLAGWACVTILGAMTQFVPVWSGTSLHSRRLATWQLPLVAGGLAGVVASFLGEWYGLIHMFGGVAMLGFWLFAYNLARTLWTARPLDVTERHFAAALSFFVLVPAFGVVLALGYAEPLFAGLPVSRAAFRSAHVTLAVYGAVLSTVVGGLYQLATMFTQTDLSPVEVRFQRVETVAYPLGVVLLAAGRLLAWRPLAAVGGVLVALSLAGVGVVVARLLRDARVPRTPMLTRYAVVAGALVAWGLLTAAEWVRAPLDPALLFGAAAPHLLLLGVVGFVVLGTLYHIVPFIVWVHRYSDLLGFEDVPMIDDLYDSRLATVDFWAVLGGSGVLLATTVVDLPPVAVAAGGLLTVVGVAVFAANLLLVVRRHSPHTVPGLLWSRLAVGNGDATESASPSTDGGRRE
ncbi:MAG: hypothetical protein ABEJ89_07555 [Haloarculaceae archaeon]